MANLDKAGLESAENAEDDHDDEVYPESSAASHLGLALLDLWWFHIV